MSNQSLIHPFTDPLNRLLRTYRPKCNSIITKSLCGRGKKTEREREEGGGESTSEGGQREREGGKGSYRREVSHSY